MDSIISKYPSIFNDNHALMSIKTDALMYTIKKHDDSKGNKFTSSLYNITIWFLNEFIKNNNANKNKVLNTSESYDFDTIASKNRINLSDFEDIEDFDLLVKKYIYKMTMKELSREFGCSIPKIAKRIEKAQEKCRLLLE